MSLERMLSRTLRGGDHVLFGGKSELKRLFGSPLPVIPPGEIKEDGGETLSVETHSSLREMFARCLSFLVQSAGEGSGATPPLP